MRNTKKALEELSEALETINHGKRLELADCISDTLPSKISHQLVRLSDQIWESKQQVCRERDGLKELISEIAHQLRNPLANMESYLELLSSENLSAQEQTAYFQAVIAAEQRIRFLTESFIKMARLESRVIQIRKESCSLHETLLSCILQIRQQALEKHIDVQLSMEPRLSVPHDANWLGEAVVNLLDNSVKYMQDGGRILIKAEKNAMFTEISVEDDGIGIEEGEENLIFQRFYRGKRVTVEEGFGIGLYLAREIISQHDGFMKVKRQKQGLKVSIFLPAR